MSSTDDWMGEEIPRGTKVGPIGGRVLRIRFAGDREGQELDITGLIARSAHFAPLMDDAQSFAKVVVVKDGLGVAFPNRTNRFGCFGRNAMADRREADSQVKLS